MRPATTTWPGLRWAPRSAGRCCREACAPGDAILGLASTGVHSNGFSLLRRVVPGSGLALGRAGAVRSRRDARPGGDGADADLRPVIAGAASRRLAESRGAHHRRRAARQPAARPAARNRGGAAAGLAGAGGVPLAGPGRRHRAGRDVARVQLRRGHGAGGRRCRPAGGVRAVGSGGRDGVPSWARSRQATGHRSLRIDLPPDWPA